MSIRTAIEINHDFHDVQDHKRDRIMEKLMDALYDRRDDAPWDALREFGIQRVYQCHHGDDRLEAHKSQSHPANFRRTP